MFIAGVSAVVLSIAGIDLGNALGVLASELRLGASPVVVLAVLAFVGAVAAVVVMVAHPGLENCRLRAINPDVKR